MIYTVSFFHMHSEIGDGDRYINVSLVNAILPSHALGIVFLSSFSLLLPEQSLEEDSTLLERKKLTMFHETFFVSISVSTL